MVFWRSFQTFARFYHKQGEMCKCFEGPYTLVKQAWKSFSDYDLALNQKYSCLKKSTSMCFLIRPTEVQKPDRKPDQREIFMDELVCLYKLTCIGIFPIWASEVQKPETGQKTGPGPQGKFYVQMNQHVKRNLPA